MWAFVLYFQLPAFSFVYCSQALVPCFFARQLDVKCEDPHVHCLFY